MKEKAESKKRGKYNVHILERRTSKHSSGIKRVCFIEIVQRTCTGFVPRAVRAYLVTSRLNSIARFSN